MISLLIPTCGGNIENFKRTADSARSVCDEVVAISTCLFKEDLEAVKQAADKVVELPWCFTFQNGFGEMHNKGHRVAKNDWIILLGVGETIHSGHERIKPMIQANGPRAVLSCWHINDPNHWRRLYNRNHAYWSGGIHESVVGGEGKGDAFEMRDTDKLPLPDPFKQEALKWYKGALYNARYRHLLRNPDTLGGTDRGWLAFVAGAKESIEGYCEEHKDLVDAGINGDLVPFLEGVRRRMDGSATPKVNFAPQGQPMTPGA